MVKEEVEVLEALLEAFLNPGVSNLKAAVLVWGKD